MTTKRAPSPVDLQLDVTLELSLFYFGNASSGTRDDAYELLREGARFADEYEFAAIWTPERHFHEFGGNFPNPALTSAALAFVTERIELRAGSVVAPLHDPLRLAEEWAVVDNLSHGRAGLSLASGWHAVDFTLAPDAYAGRRDRTIAVAQELRHLWSGGSLKRVDGKGEAREVSVFPRPVRRIPLWLTSAGSPETFKAAGAAGLKLLTHMLGQTLDQVAENIVAYREAFVSPDGDTPHVTLMLHTFLGQDIAEVRAIVYEPMREYLRTSLSLDVGLKRNVDLAAMDEDVDFLLDRAFDRYFRTSGLFGTVDSCAAMIERVRAAGVDEVACLVDFGPPVPDVLASFDLLAELRRAW